MNEKLCSTCKVKKSTSEFYKNNKGFRTSCKDCRRKKDRDYHRSKKGLITKMFSKTRRSSINREMPPPGFTKKELSDWVLSQAIFHELYEKYKDSGYKSDYKPSIDRKNDYKPYNFCNMQILTWDENFKKSRKDMSNGNNTKICRAVVKYTKEGIFIQEYFSLSEAARQNNIDYVSILNCCRGRSKTSVGFIWKYKHKGFIKEKQNLKSD